MTKTEREEYMPLKMFVDGIKIAQKKADGKPHTVRVYLTIWQKYSWHTLVVDDRREAGNKLGVGTAHIVHEAVVVAPMGNEEQHVD